MLVRVIMIDDEERFYDNISQVYESEERLVMITSDNKYNTISKEKYKEVIMPEGKKIKWKH